MSSPPRSERRWTSSLPGTLIRTTPPTYDDTVYLFTGTSAATPLAAGIVSLLLAEQPSLSQDEVYALLRAGADDQVGLPAEDTPGYDIYHGHGRLNADRTLRKLIVPIGAPVCPTTPNSVGNGATFIASGSSSVADNQLVLRAACLPPGVLARFFFGPTSTNTPFGDGTLCVGGTTTSLPGQTVDAGGLVRQEVDLTAGAGASIVAGTDLVFQLFYRDVPGGPAGFNLSNAIRISWQ